MMEYLDISMSVEANTRIDTTDRPHPDLKGVRIINLTVGRLRLMLPSSSDEDALKVIDRLHEAIHTLRDASIARLPVEPLSGPVSVGVAEKS